MTTSRNARGMLGGLAGRIGGMGGMARGAMAMAGGPIGIGFMAAMTALPMFMQKGAESGQRLNRELGFFSEQALKTGRDVQGAARALRDLRVQTGASLGQIMAMGTLGGFGAAQNMAMSSARLRESLAMFRPNREAMLGATMLGVNPLQLGRMQPDQMQRTLEDAVKHGLAAGMNEDAARGWLKQIVGEDAAKDVMEYALLSPAQQEWIRMRQEGVRGVERDDRFQALQGYIARQDMLNRQLAQQKDLWQMEKEALRSEGRGTRWQEFRQSVSTEWMDAIRAFWVAIQPGLKAFRDMIIAFVGADPSGAVGTFGDALRVGGAQLGQVLRQIIGIFIMAVSVVGIFVETIVRIGQIIMAVIKGIEAAAGGRFGQAREEFSKIGSALGDEFVTARTAMMGWDAIMNAQADRDAMNTETSWQRQAAVPMPAGNPYETNYPQPTYPETPMPTGNAYSAAGPMNIQGNLNITSDGSFLSAEQLQAGRTGRQTEQTGFTVRSWGAGGRGAGGNGGGG